VPLRGRLAVRDDPEFGAASQLEKIDMLDFADFVAINKFDRKGAEDALRDVRKQVQRNREAFGRRPRDAGVRHHRARFNDDGVTALYQAMLRQVLGEGLAGRAGCRRPGRASSITATSRHRAAQRTALPGRDRRYRAPLHAPRREQARVARERQQLREPARLLGEEAPSGPLSIG
jgi:isobutyryl-CoA mutase